MTPNWFGCGLKSTSTREPTSSLGKLDDVDGEDDDEEDDCIIIIIPDDDAAPAALSKRDTDVVVAGNRSSKSRIV